MSKRKLSPHRPSGRRPKHGAYAITFRDEILRQYPELARYTLDCRDALVKDLAPGGPDTLSMAKQIILDRLISKLLTAGLLDIFLGKHGVIRRDRLDQRVLEAEPIVATWLSVNNAILRDLEALGLERQEPAAMNVLEYARLTYGPDKPQEAEKGPVLPQDRLSPGGEGDWVGKVVNAPEGDNSNIGDEDDGKQA